MITHFDAESTHREETFGGDIASYSERETEWFDRTLKFELPAGSLTNDAEDWQVVSGEGESGGSRGWSFKFTPEATVSAYATSSYYGAEDFILVNGTLMTTPGMSGRYSDSYRGKEIYNVGKEEWQFLSGHGSGNGTLSGTYNMTLNADVGFAGANGSDCISADVMADAYSSNYTQVDQKQLKVKFTVDNGAWKRNISQDDKTDIEAGYNMDASGTALFWLLGMDHDTYTRKMTGEQTYTEHQKVSMVYNDIANKYDIVSASVDRDMAHEWESEYLRTCEYPGSGGIYLTEMVNTRQNLTYKDDERFDGSVWTGEYSGEGKASGEKFNMFGGSDSDRYEFSGDITRDTTTGMFLAESHVKYDWAIYYYGNGSRTATVNYLGFVNLRDYPNPYQYGTPTVLSTPKPLGCHQPDELFEIPVPDFDLSGCGIGVSFSTEPFTMPDGLFDSGLERFMQEQVPPPYVPMVVQTVPLQTPLQAFGSGLKTGTKANVNALSGAIVSTATIGMVEEFDLLAVTAQDRMNGYDKARMIAGISSNILVGVASGGTSCLAAKSGSTVVKGIGYGVKFADIGGNAVGLAKNSYDIYDNGPSLSNVAGLAGNGLGLAGNIKQACFTEGTQIVVGMEYDADGVFVQYVTVNIEDIQVGDLVYSYNTLTGEVSLKAVTDTFVRNSDHINYLTIVDEHGNEQTIETTDGHPFWVVTDSPDLERAARSVVDGLYHENVAPTEHGYWVEANDLRVGDVFLGANGELSVLVDSVRVEFAGNITVYNFSVGENHNYFVIARDH